MCYLADFSHTTYILLKIFELTILDIESVLSGKLKQRNFILDARLL
jgi:hypothetical protein